MEGSQPAVARLGARDEHIRRITEKLTRELGPEVIALLRDPTGPYGGYDSQQILAAEIGRQLGQLGMEMARRNLSIQPTLEIRPGYRFVVMVTKDIVLPPWQGHPLATSTAGRR